MIAPTRVVLGPGQRTTELVLVNRGTEAAAFRLQVENRRMRADGAMEAAETARPGELFAADMVRFAPRQLVLEPGARQTVRIIASLPEGAGGRRISQPFAADVGARSAPARAKPRASDDKSLSIELIAVRSLTIPVHGACRARSTPKRNDRPAPRFSKAAPEQLVVQHGAQRRPLDLWRPPPDARPARRSPPMSCAASPSTRPTRPATCILPLPAEVRAGAGRPPGAHRLCLGRSGGTRRHQLGDRRALTRVAGGIQHVPDCRPHRADARCAGGGPASQF